MVTQFRFSAPIGVLCHSIWLAESALIVISSDIAVISLIGLFFQIGDLLLEQVVIVRSSLRRRHLLLLQFK